MCRKTVGREKITVLPGHPFVPFLAWCPGFVLTLTNCIISPYKYYDLPVFLWFFFIFVYNIQKFANSWGSALDPAGGAHDPPPDPQLGPPTARKCGTHTLPLVPSRIKPNLNPFHLESRESDHTVVPHFIFCIKQVKTPQCGNSTQHECGLMMHRLIGLSAHTLIDRWRRLTFSSYCMWFVDNCNFSISVLFVLGLLVVTDRCIFLMFYVQS